MKKALETQKLPDFFKPLFWSYDFEKLDTERHGQRIVVNTINYGSWRHWLWLKRVYGREGLKQIIVNTPASEFRVRALRLIALLLGIDIKQMKRVRSINT